MDAQRLSRASQLPNLRCNGWERRLVWKLMSRALAAVAVTVGLTLTNALLPGHADAAYDQSVWDRVAACESSGNWSINTGNGYYGGLQFSLSTWRFFGGTEYAAYPHKATKEQQIAIARRTLAGQGPGAWPVCSVRAGLTKDNGGASPAAKAASLSSSKPTGSATPGTSQLTVDGVMGPKTVTQMQRWVGSTPDGVWGRNTTRALQVRVGARPDGVRGPETNRKTQALVGATPDGVWGPKTTRALQEYLNRNS